MYSRKSRRREKAGDPGGGNRRASPPMICLRHAPRRGWHATIVIQAVENATPDEMRPVDHDVLRRKARDASGRSSHDGDRRQRCNSRRRSVKRPDRAGLAREATGSKRLHRSSAGAAEVDQILPRPAVKCPIRLRRRSSTPMRRSRHAVEGLNRMPVVSFGGTPSVLCWRQGVSWVCSTFDGTTVRFLPCARGSRHGCVGSRECYRR